MPYIDASQITDQVYIAAHPKARHAAQVRERNVRLILCMIFYPPALVYWRDPFRMLWLPNFDYPYLPISMKMLMKGVRSALPVIDRGESVMVYCREGRHRSVAMTCCILIGLGYSADEAMQAVKEKRPVADPGVWYIEERIRKFEQMYQGQTGL